MKYKAIVHYGSETEKLGTFNSKDEAITALIEECKSDLVRGETYDFVKEGLKKRDFYVCGWSSTEMEIEEVE